LLILSPVVSSSQQFTHIANDIAHRPPLQEWLVDLFAIAERTGEADAFAAAYALSDACAVSRGN
jgi:hypothetical protein